jgi:hypothetical protein
VHFNSVYDKLSIERTMETFNMSLICVVVQVSKDGFGTHVG